MTPRQIIYEITMALLALAVGIILFIDFTQPLTPEQKQLLYRVDLILLVIFTVDYFVRLVFAQDKWKFIKLNILDFVAIIPFDMTFRAARLARLARLGRLFRALRVAVILRSRLATPLGILKTNGLGKLLGVTCVLILAGAVGIYFLEPVINTFGDALWWSIVTTTTVGYGDISPTSPGGRVIAVILMLIGIGTLGMLTGSIATYFLGGNENKSVKQEQIEYVKHKLGEIDELSRQDIEELICIIKALGKEDHHADNL